MYEKGVIVINKDGDIFIVLILQTGQPSMGLTLKRQSITSKAI